MPGEPCFGVGGEACSLRSGRLALVSMMQPAHQWDRNDSTLARQCDRATDRRVLVQRQVSARLLVVRNVHVHQSLQSGRAQHDDVIETLASHRPDEPFDVSVLPRRPWRREDFFNPIDLAVFAHAASA
jgi:hypothetical protein